MGLPSNSRAKAGLASRWAGLALFAAALAGFAGCATKPEDRNGPRAREDVAEYRQIALDAQKVVKATLQSLDRAAAHTSCPPRVFKAFTQDVQRLEVDSFKMRARAQAMRARGKAYFEQWHEHLASLKDPEVRKLAEQRHDLLQQSFSRIHLTSQQTREAFQPFLAGLRRLRNGLENDPGFASADSAKLLVRTTRDHGQKVEAGLADILEELKSVAAALKPAKLVTK